MSCNHHCYDCHIPNCPQRVRQSIGPRVVPMFADPPEWSADKVYSPLTLVLYNGATYMSRCCVPAGSPLPSDDPFYNKYWVMVYDMSAQVAQYREEVAKLSEKVTAFEGQIVEWEDMVEKWTALIMDWQSQFPTLTEGLAKITERVAALEPVVAQHTADIEALKQKDTDLETRVDSAESRLDNLEPRMTAAEGEISGLHDEQTTQNNRLDALDQEQLQQDAQIKANHDLAVKNQQNINANLVQIQENAKNIEANAAEIADHAAQLENIHDTNAEQDAAIANNAAAIQKNAEAIEQNKTDIDQAEALAQQVKDELTHTNARLDEVEQKNTDQDAAIAAETTRATEAEAALDAKITAETTARTEADEAIKQSIQEINQNIEGVKGDYLPLTGGTMTGALSMGNNKVTNVTDPTENGDAVNYKTMNAMKADLEGQIGNLSDLLDVANQKIQDLEQRVEELEQNPPQPVDPNAIPPFGLTTRTPTSYTINLVGTERTTYAAIKAEMSNWAYKWYIGELTTHLGDTYYAILLANANTEFYYYGNSRNELILIYRSSIPVNDNTLVRKTQRYTLNFSATPTPDPAAWFNQIDLSGYVGSLSGSTINASNFNEALGIIVDANAGSQFYYGTDHTGTTWYFASATELSTLVNDSYTCEHGVQNNGTTVQETFTLTKA